MKNCFVAKRVVQNLCPAGDKLFFWLAWLARLAHGWLALGQQLNRSKKARTTDSHKFFPGREMHWIYGFHPGLLSAPFFIPG